MEANYGLKNLRAESTAGSERGVRPDTKDRGAVAASRLNGSTVRDGSLVNGGIVKQMSEVISSTSPRSVRSADLFGQARRFQTKADEQKVLAEGTEDALTRQMHWSAANAYAKWAMETEKTAETLSVFEQRFQSPTPRFDALPKSSQGH